MSNPTATDGAGAGALRASFYTLGCRLNQAETSLIANSFGDRGYQVVPFGESADICVINSCTVTDSADSKCRSLVRQVLRRNPETFVAIVGCYAQTGFEALQKIDGLDLIVGNAEKMRVVEHIGQESFKQAEPRVIRPRMSREPFTIEQTRARSEMTRANLKIQDGCDFMCSFCIIPMARGRARSRDFDDIKREAEALIQAGHRELVLTGVNIGTYQLEQKRILDVVDMLCGLSGLQRLRISSIEPTTIPEALLERMASSDVLCSHLHIPLQSGSDAVLERMRRKYSLREFMDFIELADRIVPDIHLATDLIVGFPGETDEEFADSCRALADSPLVYAHIFNYSSRPGTAAKKLDGHVDPRVRKERSRFLHQISNRKKADYYRRFEGQTMRVLVEDTDGAQWYGFTDNYIKVALTGEGLQNNRLVQAELLSSDQRYVTARLAGSAD